jgi:hypothetical protein
MMPVSIPAGSGKSCREDYCLTIVSFIAGRKLPTNIKNKEHIKLNKYYEKLFTANFLFVLRFRIFPE